MLTMTDVSTTCAVVIFRVKEAKIRPSHLSWHFRGKTTEMRRKRRRRENNKNEKEEEEVVVVEGKQ